MGSKIGNIVRMGTFPFRNLTPSERKWRNIIVDSGISTISKYNPNDRYGKIIDKNYRGYSVRWSNGILGLNYKIGEDIVEIPNKEHCKVIYVNGHCYICSKYILGGIVLTSDKDIYRPSFDIFGKSNLDKVDEFFRKFKINNNNNIEFVDCYYKNMSKISEKGSLVDINLSLLKKIEIKI